MIEKEFKMKPEEFDKQFLAWLEAQTKNTVDGFDDWTQADQAALPKQPRKRSGTT